MAVTFVGASEDARGTSGVTVPVPPTGTASGDLLLAVQVSDYRGTLAAMTAPAGWTLKDSTSRTADVGFVKIWTKTATGSEPATYTFVDSTSAHSNVVIVALRGFDPSVPFAVVPTFANGSSSTTHPASSVPGVANGVLVTAHLAGTNGTTRSYSGTPSGMTQAKQSALSSSGYLLLGVYYQALSSSGATGSKIANCTASTPYITMSLVVQQPSPLVVSPSGISSTSAFGAPTVNVADSAQTVLPSGIASAQAFGSPTVSVPAGAGPYPGTGLYPGTGVYPGAAPPVSTDQTISPTAIDSAAEFGSPAVSVADGAQTIFPVGIDSGEAFALADVTVDPPPPQTIEPVAIFSEEGFGRPSLALEIPVPTATGIDTYFIDAVALDQHAWAIETAEGLLVAPAPVGANVALPLRDGEVVTYGGLGQPRRPDGPGQITFNMWLLGGDQETSYVPSGSTTQKEWFDRWDELLRLLYRRSVIIDHARPDNTIRRAVAHLDPDQTVEPSRYPGHPWFARLKAVFRIPAGHWVDITPVTTGPVSLTTNGYLDLSVFADATAPCTELQVVFHAGNNPRLSTSTGHVGWNGVISAGRQLGIDTGTGFTHQASGSAWNPGFDGLTYSPGPRLFEIDPSEPLGAIFTHTTGVGVPMTVEVSGKRRYRTS